MTRVRHVLRRYNQQGLDSIGYRRHTNPDRALVLSIAEGKKLLVALQSPADSGVWTSQKVADWLSGKRGKQVNVARGRECLKRLDFSLQISWPRHLKADSAAQEAFKKACDGRKRRASQLPGGNP